MLSKLGAEKQDRKADQREALIPRYGRWALLGGGLGALGGGAIGALNGDPPNERAGIALLGALYGGVSGALFAPAAVALKAKAKVMYSEPGSDIIKADPAHYALAGGILGGMKGAILGGFGKGDGNVFGTNRIIGAGVGVPLGALFGYEMARQINKQRFSRDNCALFT